MIAAAVRVSAAACVGISAMAAAARMDIGAATVAAIPAAASPINPGVVVEPSSPSINNPAPSPWADATGPEELCAGQKQGSDECFV